MTFNITPAAILSDVLLANNLLNKTLNIDVVAVIDQQTLIQVFHDARPVRALVRETARVMDYPVETGAIVSDHRISNPTEIELTCIIPEKFYDSAYPEIRNAWQNATLLKVQTRVGTYSNMIISDLPHEEEPDMFNVITITIKMREVIFVAPSSIAAPSQLANFQPGNPALTSTVNSGLLSAVTAGTTALSYFHAGTVWGVPI